MSEDIIKPEKKVKEKKPKKPKSEKTYKYGRFNFLDALIILCVASVAVLLLFVYSPTEFFGFGKEDVEIIYTVRISGVPADHANAISVGDELTDPNGYRLGHVASDVEVQEHFVYEYREDEYGSGGIDQIQHPELVDLVITVSASAEKSDSGYTVDGKRIAVESVCDLVFPRFEAKGICLSLSEEILSEAGGAK